jgi:phage-related tail fiber protein
MSNVYYTLLTDLGAAAMAKAAATGTALPLTTVVLGDGAGSVPAPTKAWTAVMQEVYRAGINSIVEDAVNPSWYVIELVLPPAVGGFTIREFVILDSNGDAIYAGNCAPETKPILPDGMTRDSVYRLIVETSNSATIQLTVDPSVVTATHTYVDNSINAHSSANDPHGDRAAASAGLQAHTSASDPHGDRAFAQIITNSSLQGHLSQLDPHGDRAYANQSLGNHLVATDPHGDRAYTAAQVKNAFARAYFFAGH